ncbi:MAG: thioredoxin domain-containing protein [Phycisphaerales bacterium]|nr:thioredoxin domain-containing protein [Phycisphaerales bacterium]
MDDPGLKPMYAGTYFPPEPSHGMPGFPQILTALAKAWNTQREDVLDQAEKAARAVKSTLNAPVTEVDISASTVQEAANNLLAHYDHQHGGFGSAPKFPQPCNLLFLIHVLQHNPSKQLADIITHTLDRMARGGMYDQIGGGFHRYSTDAQWLVPHFEKMLYDQGQLLEVYARALALAQEGKLDSDAAPPVCPCAQTNLRLPAAGNDRCKRRFLVGAGCGGRCPGG